MPVIHIECLEIQNRLSDVPTNSTELIARMNELLNTQGAAAPSESSNGPHALVDALLQGQAEKILSVSVDDLNYAFPKLTASYQASWIVADDTQGSFTEKPVFEINRLFEKPQSLEKTWMPILWWGSQTLSNEELFFTAREQLYFHAHIATRGPIANFKSYLMVKSQAVRFSERPIDPSLLTLSKDIASTTRRYFNSSNLPELIACIYGDSTAQSLGFKPLGLPENAGHIASLVFV